jgi:multimeric flavodoxin WrbA
MSHPLKVVAVNGSPHAGIGNTSLMIQMLTPALAQEGIELEEVFLAEKRIDYCVGSGVCIEKGKCWRQYDLARSGQGSREPCSGRDAAGGAIR